MKLQRFLVAMPLIAMMGCVASSPVSPFQNQGRMWPEPPNVQRVTFVREFKDPSDLGIRESMWSKIISFAAGKQDNSLKRPMAVATTERDNIIFVADTEAGCVHRYDIKRSRYNCLSPDSGEEVFAIGLTVTADGWLFVSDSQSGQIYRAGPGSKNLEAFSVSSQLRQPTGICWDEESALLFVTDTGDQTIKVFDRQGNFKFTFGGRGSSPGQFNFPTYLWMDGNNELLVTDSLNFRVQRFMRNGEPVDLFGQNGDRPGDFSRPKGVATDSHGHIYVVDALMHAVQIFDRDGNLLMSFAEQGQGQGQFWLPNGIFVSENNTIFVTDSYNKRVQVFRYVGPES